MSTRGKAIGAFAIAAGATEGKVCGKKKCFTWKREGFLKWKFGCVDKFTGAPVACAGK
jgi:hypothetical protein